MCHCQIVAYPNVAYIFVIKGIMLSTKIQQILLLKIAVKQTVSALIVQLMQGIFQTLKILKVIMLV